MKVSIIALCSSLRGRFITSATVGLLISGLIFRGVIAYFLPPGFDEAYYFLYTQNLGWSYFDHPLAVALSTGFGVWITGTVSPFTVRLGALGLFTASLWLLYRAGCQLFGSRAGWITGAIASLSPLFFLTFGTLTAPDNALIFFWSATLYLGASEFFIEADAPYKPTSRIALLGLVVGLACLSKYHGAVLGLGLVGFCTTCRRKVFRSRWIPLSIVLFGLCLLPIVYWNAQNDWASLRFQLSSRFAEEASDYSLTHLAGVFGAELGLLFPTLGIPLWWVSGRSFIETVRNSISRQRAVDHSQVQFVLWLGLPVALGFTLLGGLTHTYPAWPAPGLWCLTLLLGRAATTWPTRLVRRWLQSTGLAVGTLLLFLLIHITLGTLQKPGKYSLLGGFITPQADPSTALIDVRQLRQRLNTSEAFWQIISTTDFVITHEFWLSGYVAMALPSSVHHTVSSFTQDPRGHAFWFDSQEWIGKDALFVSLADFDQGEVLKEVALYFQSITLADTITIERGSTITETFYLYRAHKLLRPYTFPF